MWNKRLKDICSSSLANLSDDLHEVLPSRAVDVVLQCDECAYVCGTFQQLRLHKFKSHGRIAPARKYVGALNSCPICRRRYPTRVQPLRHLKTVKKCSEYAFYEDEVDAAVVVDL